MLVVAAVPVLVNGQVSTALAGVMLGDVLVQVPKLSIGVFAATTKLTALVAAVPAGVGVAVSVPVVVPAAVPPVTVTVPQVAPDAQAPAAAEAVIPVVAV